MKEAIRIVYKSYIPTDLIDKIEMVGIESQLNVEIIAEKQDKNNLNFIETEVSDIIIYIQQHTTELIVGGLLANLAYDSLKNGLIILWNGLLQLGKTPQSREENINKSGFISIQLMDEERNIEIVMPDYLKQEIIDNVIDQSFEFIRSKKMEQIFSNTDFIKNPKEKHSIRLFYNEKKGIWEPQNFASIRRKMDEQ